VGSREQIPQFFITSLAAGALIACAAGSASGGDPISTPRMASAREQDHRDKGQRSLRATRCNGDGGCKPAG